MIVSSPPSSVEQRAISEVDYFRSYNGAPYFAVNDFVKQRIGNLMTL
jgi:hypothetical protein